MGSQVIISRSIARQNILAKFSSLVFSPSYNVGDHFERGRGNWGPEDF